MLENDFDALLFVNGHGGNGATIGDATSIVGDAHPDAQVLGLTYFELAERFIHEVRESETSVYFRDPDGNFVEVTHWHGPDEVEQSL